MQQFEVSLPSIQRTVGKAICHRKPRSLSGLDTIPTSTSVSFGTDKGGEGEGVLNWTFQEAGKAMGGGGRTGLFRRQGRQLGGGGELDIGGDREGNGDGGGAELDTGGGRKGNGGGGGAELDF